MISKLNIVHYINKIISFKLSFLLLWLYKISKNSNEKCALEYGLYNT